ncbi:MAG TPA: ABC transporter ATP-binding protein [Burkholderiaceae bacterium]|nr:ABC transporter ATP-binding protein [Burkholderiaceae bacterium]
MLVVENLSKAYGARTILDRVSFSVAAGEYVAIVGESGAGKSTLLNLIAGLERPDSGRVAIDGAAMTALDDNARTRLRRLRVGFVFQAFHVLPQLTLAQNVEVPLVLAGVDAHERAARAQALLEAVGLGARARSAPAELSGGELQRVALARALVHRPALVLADEPTGNLDPETAAATLALIAGEIRARRAAGILVTHSSAAATRCDRVLRLDAARLRPA